MSLPPRPLGIDDGGVLPLPWLGAACARLQALEGAHALLLHGAPGVGQFELASWWAQALLCEAPRAATAARAPCGRCAACHLVRQRTHPDLRVLVPEQLRQAWGWLGDDEKIEPKPSRELRIAPVRSAIDWAHTSSGRGVGKVLLLHPAEAMNAVTANALLKTLEEPPGRLKIVLSAGDAERLLPTVRSRCQRVTLALPPHDAARDWLRTQGVAEPDALLRAAGGSPGLALQWAAEGVDAALLAALPRALAEGDAAALAGRPLPTALALLWRLAHDVAQLAHEAPPRYFVWPAAAPVLRPTPAAREALWRWWASTARAVRRAEHPWSAPLLLEALVGEGALVWRALAARPVTARGG